MWSVSRRCLEGNWKLVDNPKKIGPTNFPVPKFLDPDFSETTFLWNQHFFGHKFFFDPKMFGPKISYGPIFIGP